MLPKRSGDVHHINHKKKTNPDFASGHGWLDLNYKSVVMIITDDWKTKILENVRNLDQSLALSWRSVKIIFFALSISEHWLRNLIV